MATSPVPGLSVPPELQRGNHEDREEWLDSARFLVELLPRTLSRDDLAGVDVLDVGCGTKITKTLLDQSRPVGRYVGVDVDAAIIEWLNANVSDARFEFHHLDARNDRYNPTGVPLHRFQRLPVGQRRFDLICLFSVFTHLAPDDYVAMLRLLRRHVRSDGRLLFSLFLDDPEHSAFAEALQARLASEDPAVVETAKRAVAQALTFEDRRFVDEVPDQPLLRARYAKDFALELIGGTGWEVVSLHPPERHIQHSIVCRPV